jgi:glycosyltransferase involved in cell wall biosynthesis
MLTTFYPPWSFGGDAIQVQRLSHALVERGHEVVVVHSPEAYKALARRPPAAAEDAKVRTVPIDAGLGKLSPVATYLSGRPLLTSRKLERALAEDFDVLHFHNPSLLGGPALLRMGRGVKLYTLHEQWLVCPTHVLWKYRKRVCEKPDCWRCTATYHRPPQPWRETGLLERCVRQLDALIAPSRSSAALHERFADMTRIEHLGNFLSDPEPDVDSAPPVEPQQRPYFLFAGRLEPVKGVDRLIEAFRRRRSEDLLIAGTGTLEQQLRTQGRDLEHVRFLGWLEPRELERLYRRALAVVVPTLGHESFPLVLLEAFARSCPAVVHDFGALAELAAESGAALTYSSGSELDAALARIAADGDLRRELGARGRAAYLERWTPEAHLSRYFGLIEERARERGEGELAAAASAARGRVRDGT